MGGGGNRTERVTKKGKRDILEDRKREKKCKC